MQIVPFLKIKPNQFHVEYQFSVQYSPKLLHCSIRNRRTSSLMLIEKGQYIYRFGTKNIRFSAGDIVFLPQGGCYEYTVLEPAFVYQADFKAFTKLGDSLTFSTIPTRIGQSSAELLRYFNRIAQPENQMNSYESYYNLYRIFSLLSPRGIPVLQESKIYPAVKHIHLHYNQKITTNQLCELCFVSAPQLRRLFHAEVGTTPLEYQNTLRLKNAKRMLQSSENSVSEIAAFLGFESIYSFSLFFKKKVGLSPLAFRKKQQ